MVFFLGVAGARVGAPVAPRLVDPIWDQGLTGPQAGRQTFPPPACESIGLVELVELVED